MGVHTITKGLDLPITGAPVQRIAPGPNVTKVGIVAADYHVPKPRFLVDEGDTVKRGQALFEDKKNPGVYYTSPGAGTVAGVHRGARRALVSVEIALREDERTGSPDDSAFQEFPSFTGEEPHRIPREALVALLTESGLWTALRTRPFSKPPSPKSEPPHSIFVTATDTNPLAAEVAVVCAGREQDLQAGLVALTKLTDGPVFLCKDPALRVSAPANTPRVRVEDFTGPHPAGNVGTHIHLLDPVSQTKTVWHIGYQDTIALGELLRTGRLPVERVISLAGPAATSPRLLRTRLGASLEELTAGELEEGEVRVISGSVLCGRKLDDTPAGYLGRYHNQVSVLREDRERVFFGWLAPGIEKYSVTRAFFSSLLPEQAFALSTSTNGSPRAMVPLGLYERVMPLDVVATYLLRAIVVQDITRAEELGCLELDEEDVALCTFVCPGKYNYGEILRQNLTIIEEEG